MTRKSPEFFREQFLPTLNRVTSFVQTAQLLGIDASTPHVWLRESKAAQKRGDNPSDYLFEYDGSERYLHQHVKALQKATISDIEANFRARMRDGTWRICRFQGKTVWRDDPKLIGFDDATLAMLGYPDRLLRINGELQPEMEKIEAPVDGVIAVLQANSETYRRRSSVDVNMNARISGGAVLTVGGPRQPAQISAPLPILEVIEQAADPQRALSDEEPDTSPDQEIPPGADDEDAPDPGPMIREATPANLAPTRNPLIDPQKSAKLAADFARKLPVDNSAVRAALRGKA
jgi:hypothetical protein